MRENSPITYAIYGTIGAVYMTSMLYLSSHEKYKLTALIPTIPVFSLFGLYFINASASNSTHENKQYIKHLIVFLLNTTVLFIIIYLSYSYFGYKQSLLWSVVISLIVWFIFIYLFINKSQY